MGILSVLLQVKIAQLDVHGCESTVKTSKAKEGIKNACKQKIKECNRMSAINIFSLLFDMSYEKVESLFDMCESKEVAFKSLGN